MSRLPSHRFAPVAVFLAKYKKPSLSVCTGIVVRGHQQLRFGTSASLTPMGTQAHDWFQAHQQIARICQQPASCTCCLAGRISRPTWHCINRLHHHGCFPADFGVEFATRYQGLRHDSGDPVEWGEKAIAHYEKLGIDPQSKTLVFSDNLDLRKAVELYRHFSSRVQLSFGMGLA